MHKDISEVIIKAQNGDEEAFTQVYQHYYKSAFRYAYKLTNNRSDAEDVVQESFVMIHEKIGNLKSPYAFSRWMARIILSNSVRLFQKHKEILVDEDVLLQSTRVEENIDFLPKEAFHKGLDTEVILSMICCMRPKQKEVLRLVYLEQRSFKEVADLLNLPEGTIKSRSMQAKKVLKSMVNDYLKANEPLTFREAITGGCFMSCLLTKVKDISMLAGTNILSISAISVCIVCGISAGVSTYDLYEQQAQSLNQQSLNSKSETSIVEEYPNTFVKQQFRGEDIITSKNAYFTLMNWANTKEKMELKTLEEIQQIEPIVQAIQHSDSEYDILLSKNGWYIEFENTKINKNIP